VKYYGYHKKGHYKSKYRSTSKEQNKIAEVKKTVDHDNFYWSIYYKDYCRAHENGKENTGYYPEQDR
jgi:hypothetical protein